MRVTLCVSFTTGFFGLGVLLLLLLLLLLLGGPLLRPPGGGPLLGVRGGGSWSLPASMGDAED